MVVLVLLAVCVACLAGWWWLGHTATPGQRALEERRRANRRALWSTPAVPRLFGRSAGRAGADAAFWTRDGPVERVPEPPEHQEPWRN